MSSFVQRVAAPNESLQFLPSLPSVHIKTHILKRTHRREDALGPKVDVHLVGVRVGVRGAGGRGLAVVSGACFGLGLVWFNGWVELQSYAGRSPTSISLCHPHCTGVLSCIHTHPKHNPPGRGGTTGRGSGRASVPRRGRSCETPRCPAVRSRIGRGTPVYRCEFVCVGVGCRLNVCMYMCASAIDGSWRPPNPQHPPRTSSHIPHRKNEEHVHPSNQSSIHPINRPHLEPLAHEQALLRLAEIHLGEGRGQVLSWLFRWAQWMIRGWV